MLITTTSSVEGHKIIHYCGIVSGETIIGANIMKDFFASIRDIVGGRSGSYEKILREAKDTAMQEMADMALKQGGNAIIGVDFDYENMNNMLMVVATGTAVWIE